MKQYKTILIAALCCLVIGGIIGGTIVLSNKYLNSKPRTDVSAACTGTHAKHVMTAQDGKLTPSHIAASRCDTLTITNADDQKRLMAFGVHNHHTAYDGMSERYLHKGESFTVTLDKTGTFTVHDHYQDETEGTFTVTE